MLILSRVPKIVALSRDVNSVSRQENASSNGKAGSDAIRTKGLEQAGAIDG
jgi:hypothetical protein